MPIKQLLKRSAGWLYLNSPLGRRQLQGAGVILMLHRVLADDQAAALPHRNELCVGPLAFGHLLFWLKRHFDCVPLMELLNNPGNADRPRVALTFDDGWRDNALNAFALLQRHRVPASIFLSTDFIGSRQRFWWESLGETLWGSHGDAPRQQLVEVLRQMDLAPPQECLADPDEQRRSQALAHYLQTLKRLSPQILGQLTDACPEEPLPQAMDWHQVRAMENSGLINFGPHGASHTILTRLDDQRLDQELRRSREALDNGCQQPLPVYCYPNGDHDQRVREHLTEHRYPFALGTGAGLYRGHGDPLALPRFGVSQRTASRPELLAWRIARGARA
ncbi:Polysaccharide deacetylase [Pseudomonas sp. ok272]|uniref:polysaccharide deacetylase family protein n=1 Tax=unclassified Pseudomonas TaxID=196821 RepID=UPI0008B7F36A|nr:MULTISPECIES: polysaccharide deacetylase family protein [unclassified Pseudomonas]SEM53044.1 Polysaccharide deacetylase [Pseudomonas sp. ok272]SFM24918.1 Polysaccharide deacetylase [Pseudomonas sp. ok602]